MIIGCLGEARSGKDTVANYLVTQYGFVRVGLADKIKRDCQTTYDFSDAQVWGDLKDAGDLRYPVSQGKTYLCPRDVFQKYGSAGRELFEDVWIDYALRTIKEIELGMGYDPKMGLFHDIFSVPCDRIVISDIRYKNEIAALQKTGGKVIKIIRPGYSSPLSSQAKNHSSETEQASIPNEEFDAIIYNQSTLDKFTQEVGATVSTWLKGNL